MAQTGSLDNEFALFAIVNWNNRQTLEASEQFQQYTTGLEKTLLALRNLGKSGDIDRIVSVEATFVAMEHRLHQKQDPSVLPSLKAAIEDFKVIHDDLKLVKVPEHYQIAAVSYHSKKKLHGVVTDGCHEAFNSHITRLGNRMSAVGISVPEKNILRQRQANMRTAKELYIDLQRKALGIEAPTKSKGLER